jgi:ring-1,2-phenylacetyl-CoA epoxidase subunit PaaE
VSAAPAASKLIEGCVQMDQNFTLEPWETEKDFVLGCPARPTSDTLVVSYDER